MPLAALRQHLVSESIHYPLPAEGKGLSDFHVEMALCHIGRGLGYSSFMLKVLP